MFKILFTFLIFTNLIFSENIAIIINKSSKLEKINLKKLKKLYLKKVRKINGIKIIPIDNISIRESFYKLVVKRDLRRVNAYWAKMVFSGKKQPPIAFENDERVITSINDKDTINKVIATKNSIGYVLESSLNESIRLLKIVENR